MLIIICNDNNYLIATQENHQMRMKEKFYNSNFDFCRHFAVSSDFLFNVLFDSAWKIASFFVRHKLQRFPPRLYDDARLSISYFKLGFSVAFLTSKKLLTVMLHSFFSFPKRLVMIVIPSFKLGIAASYVVV